LPPPILVSPRSRNLTCSPPPAFSSGRRFFSPLARFSAALSLGLAAALPAQAASTFNLATGTGGGTATEYSWAAPVLTVNNGADITITGTVSDGTRIAVAANATATITLNGVSITGITTANSALTINDGAQVTLDIQGDNTLVGGVQLVQLGIGGSGIELLASSALNIYSTGTGSGKLTVKGGPNFGSGIGGRHLTNGWKIIINSGNIYAFGSNGAGSQGIGSATYRAAGDIIIHGGYVEATSSPGGAGIGGSSCSSNNSNILIDGGEVVATAVFGGGAGIGSGSGCYVDNITITGDAKVTATGSISSGAGIGGGGNAPSTSPTGSITICGNAQVEATGGDGSVYTGSTTADVGKAMGGGAGIGSGGTRADTQTAIPPNSITICDTAKVTATGGNGVLADPAGPTPGKYSGSGAGIGGGGASSAGTVVPNPADIQWLVDMVNGSSADITATGGTPHGVPVGWGGIAYTLSSDADLTSVNGTAVTPPATRTMASPADVPVTVSSGKTSITPADFGVSPNATVELYTNAGFSTPAGGAASIALPVGGSAVAYVKVIAEDGTAAYYKVTLTRSSAGAAAVPTLNEWALMLLGLAMFGIAGLHAKRRV